MKPDPWGLTPTQVEVLDHYLCHGSMKLAAQAMDTTLASIESSLQGARARITPQLPKGQQRPLHVYLAWNAWRRANPSITWRGV